MKIDVYCNDGSPMGIIPPMVYTRGVGGAELSLISWAKTMAAMGHDVAIFNNPQRPGFYEKVLYASCQSFDPKESRDVFIAFRSPNRYLPSVNAEMKIHWSTDQNTVGDFATGIVPYVDKIVTISPFHESYYTNRYRVNTEKIGWLDLGVLTDEYPDDAAVRNPSACLFASVPDRGLEVLSRVWGDIKRERPDATLTITSDYRLWGVASHGTTSYRNLFIRSSDVNYVGAVPRKELVKLQTQSSVLSYPSTYDELFCVSVAESQVAGCVPVTSDTGALPSTNQWGTVIKNSGSKRFLADFTDNVLESMETANTDRSEMVRAARERFSWERICRQWDTLIETGVYPDGQGGK